MALNPYKLEGNFTRRGYKKKGSKKVKSDMHRRERRRLKHNPEADPEYKKYSGWEF